jgi:two-component SAPR family response regulator
VRHCLAAAGFGENALQRHGNAYRLDLGDAVSDVGVLEDALDRAPRHAAAGEVEAALALWDTALETYRGELLPELGPTDWVVDERERLRLATSTAAIEAARLRRGDGQVVAALRCVRRATELDPWSDTAWRLLAEIQDAAGDPTAAAVTRARHAEVRAELMSPVAP